MRASTKGLAIVSVVAGYALGAATFFVGQRPFGLADDVTVHWACAGLAALALAVTSWDWWCRRAGRVWPEAESTPVFVALGLSGALAFTTFGHFHFGVGFVHAHDVFHYHVASKYFDELGYTRLYECSEVALVESGRRDQVLRHVVDDLETGDTVRPLLALAHPDDRCKRFFTPERWRQFSHDVRTYRAWLGENGWEALLRDHGFNGTPVWMLLGRALPAALERVLPGEGPDAPPITVSRASLWVMALIDPLLLALMLGLCAWAFGPRGFALAGVMLGCNAAAGFSWTGGAFLRQDWLCCTIASLCFLHRASPRAAGASLALAVQLRLFPLVACIGVAFAALRRGRAVQDQAPVAKPFATAFALASVALMALATLALPAAEAASTYRATPSGDDAVAQVQVTRVDPAGAKVEWLGAPALAIDVVPPGVDADGATLGTVALRGRAREAGQLTVGVRGAVRLGVPTSTGASPRQLADDWAAGLNAWVESQLPPSWLGVWPAFVDNISKHARLRGINSSGAPVLAWFLAGEVHRATARPERAPPWLVTPRFELDIPPVGLIGLRALQLAGLAALWLAVRRSACPAWVAAALALGLVPLCFSLPNYYFSVLVGLALVGTRLPAVGVVAMTAALATNLVALGSGSTPLELIARSLGWTVVALALAALSWGLVARATPVDGDT